MPVLEPKGETWSTFGRGMAKEFQVKKRRPVRRKHIAPLLKELEEGLNIDLAVDGAFLEMANYGPWPVSYTHLTLPTTPYV